MSEEARKAINMRFPPSLVEAVDLERGDEMDRTAWVEDAIRLKLRDLRAEREVFGRFACPVADCEFVADSPKATCPTHARTVRAPTAA